MKEESPESQEGNIQVQLCRHLRNTSDKRRTGKGKTRATY